MDLQDLAKDEDLASKAFHKKRLDLLAGDAELTDRMKAIRKASRHSVDRCHAASLTLKSAYSTILYPKFAVAGRMVSKGNVRSLPKAQKASGSQLRHGELRVKAIAKLGLLGKVVAEISEGCSSMACPWCLNIHSPGKILKVITLFVGIHHLHHCPNPSCRKIAFRDECGRTMSVLATTRALGLQTALNVTDSPPMSLLGGPP